MVSRRKILSRSRDDLNLGAPEPEDEEDVWFQRDKLFKVSEANDERDAMRPVSSPSFSGKARTGKLVSLRQFHPSPPPCPAITLFLSPPPFSVENVPAGKGTIRTSPDEGTACTHARRRRKGNEEGSC